MYLIVTRSFPPETGGMQNLMWGLTNSLSKYFMIKVFADYHNQHQNYDKEVSFSIERIGGIKLLRKYRKAHLVNEFIKNNKNIEAKATPRTTNCCSLLVRVLKVFFMIFL